MKEEIIFKNIIVNNGVKEYGISDIYSNQQIRRLVNTIITFGGLTTLSKEVNEQDGILYINSEIDFTKGSATIRNVSNKTMEKYKKTKP
ncbi:hypothetical protein ACFFVB_15835 [Formosa undariae]|uniref:Uncharacterized protein n=1 Tax=Formosa undariae TaxID=1325436 RepID=A0ABV5F538_9FLAO